MNSHDVHVESRDLAALAGLLADGTRASICLTLLDGRAWTATELARHAGVAAPTATGHLNLLVAGGLLVEERQGRHRYVRLADPETAEMIERLAAMAPRRPAPARSLSAVSRDRALARARNCYDHLAGALGVAITEATTNGALLSWEHGLTLTTDGLAWLASLGLTLPATRRPPVRSCLDWTERRPHLAGAVGTLVCRHASTPAGSPASVPAAPSCSPAPADAPCTTSSVCPTRSLRCLTTFRRRGSGGGRRS